MLKRMMVLGLIGMMLSSILTGCVDTEKAAEEADRIRLENGDITEEEFIREHGEINK